MKVRVALVAVCLGLLAVVIPFAAGAFGLLWTGLAVTALGSAAIFTIRRRNANAEKGSR